MKFIKYEYTNYSWGFNEQEVHQIDFEKKEYNHSKNGVCDNTIKLTDEILSNIHIIFKRFESEFPQNEFAYDAPMFSLTIDDKTCTQIAIYDQNPLYKMLVEFFNIFKK